MTTKPNQKQEPTSAQDADIPDLESFDVSADFDHGGGLHVHGAIEGWKYFLVPPGVEDERPDSVKALLRKDYVICVKETCDMEGTLLRLPWEVFYRRRDAKKKRREARRDPGRTVEDLPGEVTVRKDRPSYLG